MGILIIDKNDRLFIIYFHVGILIITGYVALSSKIKPYTFIISISLSSLVSVSPSVCPSLCFSPCRSPCHRLVRLYPRVSLRSALFICVIVCAVSPWCKQSNHVSRDAVPPCLPRPHAHARMRAARARPCVIEADATSACVCNCVWRVRGGSCAEVKHECRRG